MKPLVVKLGGSLAGAGTLKSWLHLIARAERPVVIVPGGGPMADAVRSMQKELRFDDRAAHEMAIMAMQQMGLALIALEPRLAPADTLISMARLTRAGRIPVWLPLTLAGKDRRIPQSWAITSDGLAARLAERLGSDCVLVKSRRVPPAATARQLARDGVVDQAFPAIVERSNIRWRIVGPGEDQNLAALVDAPATGGRAARTTAHRSLPHRASRRMSTRATARGRAKP